MNEDELSPEEQRAGEAWAAAFESELARVRVDFRVAGMSMHEVVRPERHEIADDPTGESYTMSFTIDVSGIVETLRQLPDGAGTAAFVAAYNDTHPDWRDRPSHEP